jgi:MFS family permease
MKNHKFSCAAGLFIYAIGWVALLFLDNTLHLYIVVTIFGIGRAGVEVMPALVAEQFGRLSMSRVYGFINVFGAAGGVVGPILAGWIYDSTSSYILAWLTGAVISFVGAILFILVGNSPYEEKLKSDATPRGAL